MASAVAPAVEKHSNPLEFPIVNNTEKYKEVVKAASDEYQRIFKPFSNKLKEADDLIIDWTSRHTSLKNRTIEPMPPRDAIEKECSSKVETYVGFRDMRDEVDKVIVVFTQAIAKCQPQPLDTATLIVLQKLGVSLTDLSSTYKRAFTTNLNHLIEEKKRLEMLSKTITEKVTDLKLAGDILGEYIETPEDVSFLSTITTGVYNMTVGVLNRAVNRAPYFTKKVDEYTEARKLAKTAAPIEEEKSAPSTGPKKK